MYWKSVKQQNLPITIKYPKMVTEIVPHFSDAEFHLLEKQTFGFSNFPNFYEVGKYRARESRAKLVLCCTHAQLPPTPKSN
jgi:hypothetical protein